MRRSIVSLFSFLAIALIALTGCQEPQNTVPGSVDSISVRVIDSADAKTITPDGNVDVSHYKITVHNDVEDIHKESDYLTKGAMFSVSNVPAGTWYATVDAYVQRDGEKYLKVASARSGDQVVAAGSSATLVAVLDMLDEARSGNITVALKMPAELSGDGDEFNYQYQITGLTNAGFSYSSAVLGDEVDEDGIATISINANTAGLNQGAYIISVTVFDGENEEGSSIVRKGVEVMRLLPGLAASGEIDFTSQNMSGGFDVSVVDTIGNYIELGGADYDTFSEDCKIILDLNEAENDISRGDLDYFIYADGEKVETEGTPVTYKITSSITNMGYEYTFSGLERGCSHILSFIVYDSETSLSAASLTVKVSLPFESDDMLLEPQLFKFKLNNDKKSYTVTGLLSPQGQFVQEDPTRFEIPSEYNGLPITAIADGAFRERIDITGAVVIPDSVLTIGEAAFYGCWNITGVDFPDNLQSIGRSAFNGCVSLAELVLPTIQLTEIGKYAFGDCDSLVEVVVPDCVQTIGAGLFRKCDNLEKVVLSDSIEILNGTDGGFSGGIGAFEDCVNLKEVELPENLKEIGPRAFYGCANLTGEFIVPETVTKIGWNAFYKAGFSKIILHEGIEEIGSGAFSHLANWDSSYVLDWPDKVTVIESNMFDSSSISVALPDTITEIQSDAAVRPTEDKLPPSLVELGGYSPIIFSEPVKVLKLPRTLESIGDWANLNRNSTLNSCNIYIPSNVEVILEMGIGSRDGDFIYCEIGARPAGWENDKGTEDWSHSPSSPSSIPTIFWNVPEADFDAIMNNDSVPYTVPGPVISVDGGNATITCEKGFARIYYTTDGSNPTRRNGTLYEAPFAVESSQTVKAVAYVGNDIYSEIVEYSVQ